MAEFDLGSVIGPRGLKGDKGEKGDKGDKGDRGEQGAPGVSAVEVYGVRIDTTDSNPETCCEYTDNAVGMLPAHGNNGNFNAGDWATRYPFNAIKPCLFKNGAVVGYLNPNNFAVFADTGLPADITSGDAGDVMIEIPKFYYKISRNGNYIDVKIANALMAGFTDYAFKYKGESKDKFYIGAYLGYVDANNKLRSLSGKTVTGNKTICAFRTAAQANGAGYEQLSFNKLTALQVLYLVMFKSLDSQTALGKGYTNASAFRTTGATNTKGMTYGTTGNSTANDTVKFLGIEDFWGNLYQWIDGYVSGNGVVLIGDGNFNDTGNGYDEHAIANFPDTDGNLSAVTGDNITGFTPTEFDGSSTTYFCDYAALYAGCLPFFGGSRDDGAGAGAFQLDCDFDASGAYSDIGARLAFCG